jgi:hypothetical protein
MPLSTGMKTFILPCIIFLAACNDFADHIEQHVDQKIEEAKKTIEAELEKTKLEFTTSYQTALNKQTDSLQKQKLQALHASLADTDSYLDSIKKEMNAMDPMDVNKLELINATFLYRGVGDSIFNKLKSSIGIAHNATKTERGRAGIQALNDSLFKEPDRYKWQEQYFNNTGALGAVVILNSLQSQLYAIGKVPLNDY